MYSNTDKLDKDIPSDVLEVLKVAALLDITEFKVLALAWAQYFGARPEDRVIERYFARYMFCDVVPYWVHHFTRCILNSERSADRLRVDYGLKDPPASPRLRLAGQIYTVILVAILVAMVLMSASDALRVVARGCYFPPCY